MQVNRDVTYLDRYDIDKFIVEKKYSELTEKDYQITSLAKLLNDPHRYTINREECPNIYKVVHYAMTAMIYPTQIGSFPTETIEKIIFPAFYSRSVVIRHPQASELNRIQKLYMYTTMNENSKLLINKGRIISNTGKISSECLVLQTKITKQKIYGAIFYNMQGKRCIIKSLKIHSSYQAQKMGTLLLSAAITNAKHYGCRTVYLESSEEAIPFYLSLKFMPQAIRKLDDYTWWEQTELNAQITIAERSELSDMNFKMCDFDVLMSKVQEAIANVKTVKNVSSEKIVLPQEPFELGWLDKSNFSSSEFDIEGMNEDEEMDEDVEMCDKSETQDGLPGTEIKEDTNSFFGCLNDLSDSDEIDFSEWQY